MVALRTNDISRAWWHLGYSLDACDPADIALFERNTGNLRDTYFRTKIEELLDECDRRETQTYRSDEEVIELITGDINRSVVRTDPGAQQRQIEAARRSLEAAYDRVVKELALKLAVPNYRDPGWYMNRALYRGLSTLAQVVGPADTSRGTKLWLSINY